MKFFRALVMLLFLCCYGHSQLLSRRRYSRNISFGSNKQSVDLGSLVGIYSHGEFSMNTPILLRGNVKWINNTKVSELDELFLRSKTPDKSYCRSLYKGIPHPFFCFSNTKPFYFWDKEKYLSNEVNCRDRHFCSINSTYNVIYEWNVFPKTKRDLDEWRYLIDPYLTYPIPFIEKATLKKKSYHIAYKGKGKKRLWFKSLLYGQWTSFSFHDSSQFASKRNTRIRILMPLTTQEGSLLGVYGLE